MPKTLKIVGLGGSLAGNSKSRAALRTALDGAASAGAGQVEEGLAHLGSPHCQDCRDERRAISPDDSSPLALASSPGSTWSRSPGSVAMWANSTA